jgi:hypothetical protein
MATKLTLTLDKEIIEAAKEYAKKNNISLSGIVELYFKSLSSGIHDHKTGPITRELSGIAGLPAKKPDRELLEEALNKKFL